MKKVLLATTNGSKFKPLLGYYYDWFFIPECEKRTLSKLTEDAYLEYSIRVLWPITGKIIDFLRNN